MTAKDSSGHPSGNRWLAIGAKASENDSDSSPSSITDNQSGFRVMCDHHILLTPRINVMQKCTSDYHSSEFRVLYEFPQHEFIVQGTSTVYMRLET
jgi:hypothetical protein